MQWTKVRETEHCGIKYDIVQAIALIRENATGEVVEFPTEEWMEQGYGYAHPSTFNWAENNFSCDCNRKIFFDQAKGCEDDDSDISCGDGKFSVNLKNALTGEIYYEEYK